MKQFWAFILFVAVTTAHCQCLVPVGDGPGDAGSRDAGATDAGRDAGQVAECINGSDCPGAEATVPACSQQGTAAGFSCIAGRCVWDCAGGRSCIEGREPRGICFSCGAARPFCREVCMVSDGATSGTVEQSTCPQGSDFFKLEWFRLREDPSCGWEATSPSDGTSLGRIEKLDSQRLWANLPSAGGVCSGEILVGDSRRWIMSCPDCQFVVLKQ